MKPVYHVISLFPELIAHYLDASIPGRAREADLYGLDLIQLRDFAINDYGKVDDTIYGGGYGMLMRPEPLYDAWRHASGEKDAVRTLYCSPRGRTLDQDFVKKLAAEPELIIICGHYEGIDERVLDACDAEEVSLGDFVMTGGELCAMALLDAVIRLLPGALPSAEVWQDESFASKLLEEAQYTRPAEWRGAKVPDVLLSGDTEKIERYRRASALRQSYEKRPELLENAELSADDWRLLIRDLKKRSKKSQKPEK